MMTHTCKVTHPTLYVSHCYSGAAEPTVWYLTLVQRERGIATLMMSVRACWSVAVITVPSFLAPGVVRTTVVREDVLRTGHVDRARYGCR